MGTGSTYILWYASCFCLFAIVVLIAWALVSMGRREERALRAARAHAARVRRQGSKPEAGATPGGADPLEGEIARGIPDDTEPPPSA
ncbi:MAG: hypothetical protein OEY14_13560 [Myxococcales bacterium]|nr:hypothetical protein [Myxococcales bacterium]